MNFDAPSIDYAGLSPVIALTAGVCVVLIAGLVSDRGNRWLSTALTLTTLGAAAGLMIILVSAVSVTLDPPMWSAVIHWSPFAPPSCARP